VERSELIEEHLHLVRRITQQVAVRFPRHVDRAELARAGALGLVEAAGRFDDSRGVPFGRFAATRIRGAMLDTLRASDWAPRSVRTSARRLASAEQRLAVRDGRLPSNRELADALAMSPGEVADVRAGVARSVVLTLEHLSVVDGGAGGDRLGDRLADRTAVEPEEILETQELMGYLRDAIRLLPDRHRAVVLGYFIDGRTSRDLAAELDVTESRVSQLRTEALAMLRDGIEAQYRVNPDDDAGGRVARRRARYATAIGEASTWRHRLGGAIAS
jgi:RNA polymerase sigma factor for flagellar operon FliA